MYVRKHRPVRRGTILPLVALSMVAVLGVVALSLDGGQSFEEHRTARGVADAAAMAAATDLYHHFYVDSGHDSGGTARASALATALANGYDNSGGTSVIVNIPPNSGPYVNKRGYVEVLVKHRRPRAFSRVFGSEPLSVTARAVAMGAAVAADAGIIVLDPSARSALNSSGGGNVTVEGAPIYVNSTHVEAAAKTAGGGLVTAPDIYVTGNYVEAGSGLFDATMHVGNSPITDPLAALPAPDVNSLALRSNKRFHHTAGAYVLLPGVYRGGIDLSGSASVVLLPGIYFMDGGGFSFSGGGSLVGNGVMIYNGAGNGNSAGIDITGNGIVELSGPTSGTYKNLTIFQDRANTSTANIAGNGLALITGTFYLPSALLHVAGNGRSDKVGSQYISRKLDLVGDGNLHITWDPNTVVPARALYLVE